MRDQLGGAWAPILTPFDRELHLDLRALRAHVAWLRARGIEGLVALGSNGEFASLSTTEKRRLLETLAAVRGELGLIAGIAGTSFGEALELGAAARELGCDALLVLPPLYPRKLEPVGLRRFFERTLDHAGLPALLYHLPQGSGVALDALLDAAADHPLAIGIKDSSGDPAALPRIRERFARARVFLGGDGRILEGLRAGAVGSITAAANCVPELVRAIYDAFRAGEPARAEREQEKLSRVRSAMEAHVLPAAAKAMLRARGLDVGGVRPPLLDLDERAGTELAQRAAVELERS
ncbi:MAG: dihydrodipicolinate synthase family protein [Planctomycetes bacterium]|nr:dihydrodipicolinate synthase family protein [Planctomycetota bacterium]